MKAELVTASAARLGEGPAVDPVTGALTWVDILAGELRRFSSETVSVGTALGAALPGPDGTMLLVVRGGFAVLGADGTVTPLLDVLGSREDLRFNDAKCDPRGRAFAGTMSYDESRLGAATLYRLDDGPAATPVLTGVSLSNGLGWSPDGTVLYHADTTAHRVTAYEYDLATGSVGDGRVFVSGGLPDGLCVDDDGGVWVAMHGDGTVIRHAPDGTPGPVVEVPVPRVTSCAFAGDQLYITTADGGGLWSARPGFTGSPATVWQPVSAG